MKKEKSEGKESEELEKIEKRIVKNMILKARGIGKNLSSSKSEENLEI